MCDFVAPCSIFCGHWLVRIVKHHILTGSRYIITHIKSYILLHYHHSLKAPEKRHSDGKPRKRQDKSHRDVKPEKGHEKKNCVTLLHRAAYFVVIGLSE